MKKKLSSYPPIKRKERSDSLTAGTYDIRNLNTKITPTKAELESSVIVSTEKKQQVARKLYLVELVKKLDSQIDDNLNTQDGFIFTYQNKKEYSTAKRKLHESDYIFFDEQLTIIKEKSLSQLVTQIHKSYRENFDYTQEESALREQIIERIFRNSLLKYPLNFYNQIESINLSDHDLNQSMTELEISNIPIDILLDLKNVLLNTFMNSEEDESVKKLKEITEIFNIIEKNKIQNIDNLILFLNEKDNPYLKYIFNSFLKDIFDDSKLSITNLNTSKKDKIKIIFKLIESKKIFIMNLRQSIKIINRLEKILEENLNFSENKLNQIKEGILYNYKHLFNVKNNDNYFKNIFENIKNFKTILAILLFPIIKQFCVSLFDIKNLTDFEKKLQKITPNNDLANLIIKDYFIIKYLHNFKPSESRINPIDVIKENIKQLKVQKPTQAHQAILDFQQDFTLAAIRNIIMGEVSQSTIFQLLNQKQKTNISSKISNTLIKGLKKTFSYPSINRQDLRYLTHTTSTITGLLSVYNLKHSNTLYPPTLASSILSASLISLTFFWAIYLDQITRVLDISKIEKDKGASSLIKHLANDIKLDPIEKLKNLFTNILLTSLLFFNTKDTVCNIIVLGLAIRTLAFVSPRAKKLAIGYNNHYLKLPIMPFSTTLNQYATDMTRTERTVFNKIIFGVFTANGEQNMFTSDDKSLIPTKSYPELLFKYFFHKTKDSLVKKLRGIVRDQFVYRVLKSDQENALKFNTIFEGKIRHIIKSLIINENITLYDEIRDFEKTSKKPINNPNQILHIVKKFFPNNTLETEDKYKERIKEKADDLYEDYQKFYLTHVTRILYTNLTLYKFISQIKDFEKISKTSINSSIQILPIVKKFFPNNTLETEDKYEERIKKIADNLYEDYQKIINITINSFDIRPQTEKFAVSITDKSTISSERIQRYLYNLATLDTRDKSRSYLNAMMYIDTVKKLAQNFFWLLKNDFFSILNNNKGEIKDILAMIQAEFLRTYSDETIKQFFDAYATMHIDYQNSTSPTYYVKSLLSQSPHKSIDEQKHLFLNFQINNELTNFIEILTSKVEETEEKQNISTETLSKLINQIDPSLPIPEKVKQEIQYNTYYKSLIQVCERIKNVILDITDLDKKLSNFNFLIGAMLEGAFSIKFIELLFPKASFNIDYLWRTLTHLEIIEDSSDVKISTTINLKKEIEDLKFYKINIDSKKSFLKLLEKFNNESFSNHIYNELSARTIVSSYTFQNTIERALRKSKTEDPKKEILNTVLQILKDETQLEENESFSSAKELIIASLNIFKIFQSIFFTNNLSKQIKLAITPSTFSNSLKIEGPESFQSHFLRKLLYETLKFNYTVNTITPNGSINKMTESILKNTEIQKTPLSNGNISIEHNQLIHHIANTLKSTDINDKSKLLKLEWSIHSLDKLKLLYGKEKVIKELTPLKQKVLKTVLKYKITDLKFKQLTLDDISKRAKELKNSHFSLDSKIKEKLVYKEMNSFEQFSIFSSLTETVGAHFKENEIEKIKEVLKYDDKNINDIKLLTLNTIAFRAYLISRKIEMILDREQESGHLEIISVDIDNTEIKGKLESDDTEIKRKLKNITQALQISFPAFDINEQGIDEIIERLHQFKKLSDNKKKLSDHKTNHQNKSLIECSNMRVQFLEGIKQIHINTFGIKPGLFRGLVLALTETSSASIMAMGLIPIQEQKSIIISAYKNIFDNIDQLEPKSLELLINKFEDLYTIKQTLLKSQDELENLSTYSLELLKLTKEQLLEKFKSTKNNTEKYVVVTSFISKINDINIENLHEYISEKTGIKDASNQVTKKALQTIYYIISNWITEKINLVDSSFITELFAKQSAVPAIIQNNFNDLGELSNLVSLEKNSADHSPLSFMSYRHTKAKSTNFEDHSAAFGYGYSNDFKETSKSALSPLEKFQSLMPWQPKPKRATSRACLGFKIPHDELLRIINYLIFKGKYALLASTDEYFPTFNHDPDISRSIFTLANTREGLLCFNNIDSFTELTMTPIKEKIESIVESKTFEKLKDYNLKIPLNYLNLTFNTRNQLTIFLAECGFMDEKDISFNSISLLQISNFLIDKDQEHLLKT